MKKASSNKTKDQRPEDLIKALEESRAALAELLESVEKENTQAIISNLADGLLAFDSKNELFLINPQAEKILGLKKEKLLGRTISDLSFLPTAAPLADLFEKEKHRVFRKDVQVDENLVVEITTIPMVQESKNLGTLVVLRDVTREKMVEKMKTEFVSLAAHQLRTPLSAIKWTLRMLLDKELGDISSEQQYFLERTYQSNERMISLINDLLNVTRIEEGRYIGKKSWNNLETLVRFVVNSYKEQIGKRKIKFALRTPQAPLPRVFVDVEKLRLVIQNLFDNAMSYTPEGGEITISLKGDAKEVEFSIRDTGVGIPKNQQTRVFSKFFRADNVIRMETEGTGLGLFIAKNIIEAHDGRIWFESEEKRGSTFYFTLPVQKEL